MEREINILSRTAVLVTILLTTGLLIIGMIPVESTAKFFVAFMLADLIYVIIVSYSLASEQK